MKTKTVNVYLLIARDGGGYPFSYSFTQKRWAQRAERKLLRQRCKVILKTVTVTL